MSELVHKFASREARIVVIGIGYVGLPLALEFALAGYRVTGLDNDSRKVAAVNAGRSYIGDVASSDLAGSTFTITSLGTQGGLFATPILNFPEVGILGVHRIKERPVVKNGQIVIGHVMLLSLSFDHRIVDGHVGAAFAYDIIKSLENPERMFLEMA